MNIGRIAGFFIGLGVGALFSWIGDFTLYEVGVFTALHTIVYMVLLDD